MSDQHVGRHSLPTLDTAKLGGTVAASEVMYSQANSAKIQESLDLAPPEDWDDDTEANYENKNLKQNAN